MYINILTKVGYQIKLKFVSDSFHVIKIFSIKSCPNSEIICPKIYTHTYRLHCNIILPYTYQNLGLDICTANTPCPSHHHRILILTQP